MSGSVAADAFRMDEWDREAAGDADDIGGASHVAHRDMGVQDARSPGTHGAPSWTGRRLHDALAELGPVRPEQPRTWTRADQLGPETAGSVTAIAPDLVPEPANDVPAPITQIRPRADLPPPPRPYLQPATTPLETSMSEPAIFAWDDATLSDVDPTGADIVRALALADLPSSNGDALQLLVAPHPDDHDDEQERPPMIIERALAEQGLGMLAVLPAARRVNPLPALAAGFSLSLMVGAALYLFLTTG